MTVDSRQLNLFTETVREAHTAAPLAPLPSLSGIDRLAFDTETTVERSQYDRKLVGISYYLPDGRKDYLPIRHPGSENHDESRIREWVRRELRNKQLIVASGKHESDTMLRFGVDLEEQNCTFRDVLNQAPLLDDHRRKTNLELLAEEELSLKMIEVDHTLLWQMPAYQVVPVAIQDAEVAWLLNEAYTPKIKAEGLEEVLALEDSLAYAVAEMERNGVFLDVKKLVRWEAEVTEEHNKRILEIHRATGMRINPNSPEDMSRLFRHLSIPPTGFTTESGDESFTEDALLTVKHPAATLALEARQLSSLLSKYLVKYRKAVEPSGLLRYSLHQLRGDKYGTITGRFSSSGGSGGGVNIQQVSVKEKQPPLLQHWPIRELFIPPPGQVWISADASQIEVRLFAHYASITGISDRLARAYREDPDTDPHALVASWTGLIRPYAKNVNFCRLYGGGPDKIAYLCKVSKEEGKRLGEKYDQEFPEARQLLNKASDLAERRGYVHTHLGRRRRYRPGDKFYSAMNSIVQGTAADLMKIKILEFYQERKRFGLTLRFTVHDEVDGSMVDAGVLPTMQNLLNEQTTPLEVPILWKAAAGKNWHEAH